MIRLSLYLLAVAALAALLLSGLQRCRRHAETRRTGRHHYTAAPAVLDTTAVASLKPIEVSGAVALPVVTVAVQPDTAARRKAERGPIVTGVTRRPGRKRWFRKDVPDRLEIQAIDSRGIRMQNSYPGGWTNAAGWGIDSTGRLRLDLEQMERNARKERRRRRLNRVATSAIVAGAFVLGAVLGR